MKKRAIATAGIAATILPLLLVSGCGNSGNVSNSPQSTGVPQSVTNAVSTTSTSAQQQMYNNEISLYQSEGQTFDNQHEVPPIVEAVNAKGQKVTIDVTKHPVMFFAYWCPHCRETMAAWHKLGILKNEMPIFISTGTEPGDTLQTVIQKSQQDLKSAGLNPADIQVDYVMGTGAPYVSQYPVLMFVTPQGKGGIYAGSLSDPNRWTSIFKQMYS